MGYNFTTKGRMTEYAAKETKAEIEQYPIRGIPDRGLTKATCEVFGIRSGISEEDGRTVVAHYFPYYDQKGNLAGYKKRDLTKDKNDRGHFTTIGAVGVNCKLFGQQVAEANARKRKALIAVEGEYDVASAYQAMVDSVQGTKYEDLKPFIVGLSCGTVNAVEAFLHNEHFVKSFEEVVLAFDGDAATPAEKKKGIKRGKEATEDVAAALALPNIFVVEYGGNHKDASDYLQNGEWSALAKLLSFEKKKHVAEKVLRAEDISFEQLIAKRPEGVYINQFPKLMQKIHGFRKGELTVVTAPSGVGKSTLTGLCAAGFFEAGERTGMIFLEERATETMQRIVAQRLRVNYLKFKNDPTACAPVEDIRAAYDEIVKDNKLVILDHFGSLPVSELMNKVKYMHLVEGCGFIILDHVSGVVSGTETDNERKELDVAMTTLAAFCASHDVGIIVVSHINRTNAQQFLPPKGHPEGEPYWVRVTKESLRGSASLEQFAWIILGLEPEILGDRSRGRVRIVVLKNRPWSFTGEADIFSLDEDWNVVLSEEGEY